MTITFRIQIVVSCNKFFRGYYQVHQKVVNIPFHCNSKNVKSAVVLPAYIIMKIMMIGIIKVLR